MNTATRTLLIAGMAWLASVCGQAAVWEAPAALATSGGTAMESAQIGGSMGQPAIPAEREVAVICCDPRDRGRQAVAGPAPPVHPKVRASMQALEDCMVSLVKLKKEVRSAKLALQSSPASGASELRAIMEESLSTQEDYLNQTIRLYNVLFRTLSALFEELYEGASPR